MCDNLLGMKTRMHLITCASWIKLLVASSWHLELDIQGLVLSLNNFVFQHLVGFRLPEVIKLQ
jgi:hypothetical protein